MTARNDFQVRSAAFSDQRSLASLIQFSPRLHRHLDWRNPLDWIGSSPFLVAECRGQLLAALACPPDPPGVAWIRLLAIAEGAEPESSWEALWNAARSELTRKGNLIVTAIILQDWLGSLLKASGFGLRQEIVMLARDDPPPARPVPPEGFSLRAMRPYDLPGVAEVDAAAFEPVWQNSLDALNRAFPQAILPTVVENPQGLVGYQISTRNPFGAHLARLAVRPEVQRRGVGQAIVSDLVCQLEQRGIGHLTVNTQSDNRTSLALYNRLGFKETGERYPVLQFLLA